MSEIWYYVTQRLGAGASPLNGLYDNNGAETKTPTFWPDDSDGYRFVGSVQARDVADPFTYGFLRHEMLDAADGRLTYEAFRAAIALAGRPQLVVMSTGPDDAGHAMVVYRVTPQWLLVADPNYPGIGRRIRFDPATGKLGPFVSGNNAADIAAGMSEKYTRFAYVPWESVQRRGLPSRRPGPSSSPARPATPSSPATTSSSPAARTPPGRTSSCP